MSALQLFRNRNFLLLWLAQIISKFGDILYSVGIMVTVFDRTGSALQTVGVMIASTVPPFLLGPIAGALVDRHPRKRVMVIMDLLRAVLVGVLLLLVINQALTVWAIYAVVAGLATASTFFEPARLAILPSLIERKDLVRANSLVMTTNQAANAVGYAVGGVLILSVGLQTLVAIDLISFLLAGAAVSMLVVPKRSPARPAMSQPLALHQAVMQGLRYLNQHPLARPLVVMEILEHFPHAIWTSALMLVFTEKALQAGPQYWGYQSSIFYGGQLAGALLATIVATRLARRPGWTIAGNALLFSLLTLAYALSPSLGFTLALCFFFGPTSAMRDVAQDSLLQAKVDPTVLGRIYATRAMFANLAFLLAGVAFAWMADHVDVRWVYICGGLMYFGTALYALSSTAIRRSHIGELPVAS